MTWDFFVGYLLGKRSGSVIRRIAWISLIAVAISVAALILVMSVMRALNQSIEDRTLAVDPHLVLSYQGGNSVKDFESHPSSKIVKDHSEWKNYYVESQDLILRTVEGRFRGAVGRGMSAEGLSFLFREVDRVQKREFDPTTLDLEPGEVVVGVDLARGLGLFEGDTLLIVPPEGLLLPIGERPPLERVRVKRILATNLAEVDSQVVFFNYETSLKALRKSLSRKLELHIWTDFPNSADATKETFLQFPNLKVETWKERNSALFHALRLEKAVIGLFLTLASLVAGFSLLSVLGLLISQKKSDIGILQAMGMSASHVSDLFLKMGLILSSVGLLSGVVLGSALSLYLEFYPLRILPDIYYDNDIPAQLEVRFVLGVVMIGMGLSFFGMKMGAKGILRLSPTQCLKK